MVLSFFSLFNSLVTIRNWTSSNTVGITPSPDGSSEELKPSEWMEFTCARNGRSGFFTMANRDDDSTVTIVLYDGQIVALVDNRNESIDGLLIYDSGHRIRTLFINL